MRRLSPLGLRIFGLTALTIAAALGTTLLIVRKVADTAATTSIDRELTAAEAAIRDNLEARSNTLRATTERLAAVPAYVASIEQAFSSHDRSTLLDAVDELKIQLGAEWVLLTDAEGVLQAWSDHPERVGNDLSPGALIGIALQGASTSGVWLEPTDRGDVIYQAVAVPVRAPGGVRPLGAFVAALPVDSALAATLRRNTSSEIVFFTRDTGGVAIPAVSTLSDPATLAAAVGRDTSATRLAVTVANEEWVGLIGPIRTADGAPIAGVVGLRSRRTELAPYLRLERVITLSLIGGLLLALMTSAWLARRITGPVGLLVAATRRIREGDFSTPVAAESADEIGELGRAFQRMAHELAEKQRLVDYLSSTGRSGPSVIAEPASPGEAVVAVGSVLAGRYELTELLGTGGMGVVYRAFDRELRETVALKTLRPSLHFAPGVLERFKQEIRLARRITHRNVVRTHDLGESGGTTFITMEFVEGTSLEELIRRRGRLPLEVVLPIVKQLLRALEVAHDDGVIHRDIKPANLMVQASGVVKVMDFGIARLAEQPDASALTQAGAIVGSPDYMAPEQLLGEDLDPRVDLYAAGCVMYECLAGQRLHQAPNLIALIARHLEGPVPDLAAGTGAPGPMVQILAKALAKERERRWPSAAAMLSALDAAS